MNSNPSTQGENGKEDEWYSRLSEAESELEIFRLQNLDDEILEASLNEYQQHLDQLDAARKHLDKLLASTAATLDQLADISKSFRSVEKQTAGFKTQSANILEEQKQNEEVAQQITKNLKYYEPLERITRRMNAPGASSFVRTQDFRDMLVTLDECIDYMQTHQSQKEAEVYRSRYKQLLTRALTLVRNTFTNGVRDISSEVTEKLADKQINETTMSAALYAKFRIDAPAMKDLSLEIQKRAAPSVDAEPGTEGEYQSLLNELHQSFASARSKLVLPGVRKKLSDISSLPISKDIVQLARASTSYVRGVCLDEFELWGEWFHGLRGVYDFLEVICEPLHDFLRPIIIHETKMPKLCSLVTLLQTRYMNEEEEEEPPDLNELDFGIFIQPILEDAQTRLVFRTLAMLREEIEYYKPTADDLDYPRRITDATLSKTKVPALSGRKASQTAVKEDDDSGEDTTTWSRNRFVENSYPTLPKAVRLLSQIYRLVNSSVFDDLAHQIVHHTTLSLVNASNQLAVKSTREDAQLFLLRHLLLLKSQIVAFDIEYVTPDVSFDFSGVTNTFFELRDRGGLFNPRSWLRLFSSGGLLPRVVENMLDAKVELDGQLRNVINDFTAGFAGKMTVDLKISKSKQKEETTKLAAIVARTKVQKEAPVLRAKLEQYLDDLRTRETLVAAVEDQVVQAYESFFEDYAQHGNGVVNGVTGKVSTKVSRKGKGSESDVWDGETFAEWAEGIFNVALPQHHKSGTSPDSRSLSRSRSS